MILNNAPVDRALVSNVGAVGEFRIRNSAKAFSILSSGLYANKIRAIIRELSTNALDSHRAAGRVHVPYDLHLPTSLEPWFAIRDYGTGLDAAQVQDIYTTYFESTKTESNDYVGCLGLGSKSPFAYTDNFTVTAIKGGVRTIYTAFINEQGVPSIAQMMTEASDEQSGVEVKFAVDNAADFNRFRQEAQHVYRHFAHRPVVNVDNFEFINVKYEQRDIVPGVHQVTQHGASLAVMGNIAYPIDVPNPDQTLGHLANLLRCGLELHFDIGQLDFQASREGLSYIPSTVEAIRQRLQELNQALYQVLEREAAEYTNAWELALWLDRRLDTPLWSAAAIKYVTDTQFPLIDTSRGSYDRMKKFEFTEDDLASKYNISIQGFTRYRGDVAAKHMKPDNRSVNRVGGGIVRENYWRIRIGNDVYFAENDTKIGAMERGKYHWRENQKTMPTTSNVVYILSAVDKTQPMKFAEFMAALHNPPRQCKVSSWLQKPRANTGAALARDVTVLKLEDEDRGYWSRQRGKVWRDAGRADGFLTDKTYFYLPLSSYALVTTHGEVDAKHLCIQVTSSGLFNISDFYGVRKADLDWVKAQPNWVNLEDHLAAQFKKGFSTKTISGLALKIYENKHTRMSISDPLLDKIVDAKSPFVQAVSTFKGISSIEYNSLSIEWLARRYAGKDPLKQALALADQVADSFARYPMMRLVNSGYGLNNIEVVAEYINLVDRTTV
jgi:hypothetical protein